MDHHALLDQGFAWTTARVAAVPADGLDAPTPCRLWNVQELLDHTVDTLTMLTDAVAGADAPPAADADAEPHSVGDAGPNPWHRAIAVLAARSRRAWQAPGVMDRTLEVPMMGSQPAPVVASATLLELVVHGWDISQASGEAAEIPAALAVPILAFAREAIGDANRGDMFAADVRVGDSPSAQLVAFLGRTPR
jgi:uncharacterized protein (TIGR03086 family)